MAKDKSRVKWVRYESWEGQTWKVAIVIMVVLIITAGYFVVPNYITPKTFTTTFTDWTYRWVYQEAPNQTSMTGNGMDGNWSSWETLNNESDPTYTYVTYYTRAGAVGVMWKLKDDCNTANITLSATVLSEPIVKIQGFYNDTSKLITYQVYYGSAWHEVAAGRLVTANKFYDEGIWWQFVA